MRALRCRECGVESPLVALHVCELCFGPLEVAYDYEAARTTMTRAAIAERPASLWRYRELLPLDKNPTVGLSTGMTPLLRAKRLGEALGLRDLWIKNDAVCHPTLSFKDRVVSVALSRALELGMKTVACASTGNLANAVAAHAASVGLRAVVLIPSDLEAGKVIGTLVYGARVIMLSGTYDDANRLASEIAGASDWGFVNVNLRPYYAEGSKTLGYEIQEQLGWRQPAQVVVPMASGSLLTKIGKSLDEFAKLGLVEKREVRLFGAQAAGCSPIADAAIAGRDAIRPVKAPRTIAKSLAIGSPADGYYAARAILDSHGAAAAVSDEEIVSAMKLLASTEGVFTETAGGVTVAAAKKLAAAGQLDRDATTVLCITGNGLKTQEALAGELDKPLVIEPTLAAFDRIVAAARGTVAADSVAEDSSDINRSA